MDKERQPMMKRLLSILFAVTLVMGLVPLSAYAAIGDSAQDDAQGQEQDATASTQDADGKVSDNGEASDDTQEGATSSDDPGDAAGNEASVSDGEEPAADSQPASQDASSASGNTSDPYALQTAETGMADEEYQTVVYPYNGSSTPTVAELFDFFKANYPTHTGYLGTYEYTGYTLDHGSMSYIIKQSSSYTFVGSLSDTYRLIGEYWAGTWPLTNEIGSFTFQKQWDTSFATNPVGAGSITREDGTPFDGGKDSSNEGAEVRFRVNDADGQDATVTRYDLDGNKLPDNDQPVIYSAGDGYRIYEIKADQNSVVKVEYTASTTSLTANFENATVTVGGTELASGAQTTVTPYKELPAEIVPADGYAITSVKLSGWNYTDKELLTSDSFTDTKKHTAQVTVPFLSKDEQYTLTVESKKCELKLKDNPIVAVKGLTDLDEMTQRVIGASLDLENSVPSGISVEELKVEYSSNKNWTDWKELDFSPNTGEKIIGFHKFGDQDNEIIRVTYKGNAQYRRFKSAEFSIQIADGGGPTQFTATDLAVSFDGATGEKQSAVYTGSSIQPTYTVTADGAEIDSSTVRAVYVGSSHWYFSNDAPTEPGTYAVYAVYPGKGFYLPSSARCELTITQQSIDPNDKDAYRGVTVSDPDLLIVYDGKEHKWVPVVTDAAGNPLVEGTDYTVTYDTDDFVSQNPIITVTIEGKGNYTGKVEQIYNIFRQNINPSVIGLYQGVQIDSPSNVTYDGTEHKWAPTVVDKDGNPLVEGTDYTVAYSRGEEATEDFTNAGEVTVTIEGEGNYGGRVKRTYTIEKAAIEVVDSATFEYNGQERVLNIDAANAIGLVEGEVLSLPDAQVKGTEPGVYAEVSNYTWEVVKADGTTDSTGNYTISVSGTLTITAADPSGDVPSGADDGSGSADEGANGGNSATTTKAEKADKGTEVDKGTAPQTGDAAAPFAAGAALAAAAALVALFVSRKLRRSGTR